jgi:hypothetical protein
LKVIFEKSLTPLGFHDAGVTVAIADFLVDSHSLEVDMRRLLLLIAVLLIPTLVLAEHYGRELSGASPVPVAQAIEALGNEARTSVVVRDKVDSVCQVKGCWMGFATEAGDVRVTFKDYAFFVPFTIVGKTVVAEGELEKVTLSLEESRHLVEDAGGDPDQVLEPIVEYRLVAAGVKVES